MERSRLLFIYLIFSNVILCQPDQIDSIKNLFNFTPNDTTKLICAEKLSEYYLEKNQDSVIYYADLTIKIAKKFNFVLEEINALGKLGYAWMNKSNYPRALQFMVEGINLAEDSAKQMSLLGVCYSPSDEFTDRSISPGYQRLNQLSRVHQYAGILYSNALYKEKGWFHSIRALNLAVRTHNAGLECVALLTLARLYQAEQKFDSALIVERKALQIATEIDYQRYLGSIYLNLGRLYLDIHKTDSARKYFVLAIQSSIRNGYIRGNIAANLMMAVPEIKVSIDSTAIYLYSALRQALEYDSPELLSRCYTGLVSYYSNLNLVDSILKYQDLIIKIHDQVYNVKQAQLFQNIEADELLRKQILEDEKKSIREKNKNILVIIFIFFILAIALILLVSYNKSINEKRKLTEAYSLLKEARDQMIMMEKINERTRISSELHDEVGSALSGIALYSNLAQNQFKEKNDTLKESLDTIQQSTNEIINKLGDIIWITNPEKDSLPKLREKLEDYLRRMAAIKKIQVTIVENSNDQLIPISDILRKNVYLLMKEAINNAVKYSDATEIKFTCLLEKNILKIGIEDNGKGFDLNSGNGNGIQNMKNRAKVIQANLDLASGANGSKVIVEVEI